MADEDDLKRGDGETKPEPTQPDGPTIMVTTRLERSTRMFMLQHAMKPFSAYIIKPTKVFPPGSPKLDMPKKLLKKCSASERKVEDIYIYDLTSKSPNQPPPSQNPERASKRKRIYYFAGGGWQMPASSEHWALVAEIARQLPDVAVSLISYPLAPSSPAPEAFPHLLRLYHTLLRDSASAGEEVILAGDSAGGNIALCLPLAALTTDPENAPVPAAIMVMCPSTDLRRHNPAIRLLERHDPLLRIPFINSTAKAWCGDWDPSDHRVSPLTADVALLAKRGVRVHGITARYDILSPDGVLFREKCAQAHVQGEWLDWDKQMHCFPIAFAFGFPESVEAKDWIIDVLRRA